MCAFLAFSASRWQEKAAGSLFFKLGVLIKKKKRGWHVDNLGDSHKGCGVLPEIFQTTYCVEALMVYQFSSVSFSDQSTEKWTTKHLQLYNFFSSNQFSALKQFNCRASNTRKEDNINVNAVISVYF